MYFIGLKRMKTVPSELHEKLDEFLLEMYRGMHYFTPKSMMRSLQIPEEDAWDMLLEIRAAGLIGVVYVTQCEVCRHIHVKPEISLCQQCGETENLRKGVYFMVGSM